jgi:hypothetical protein
MQVQPVVKDLTAQTNRKNDKLDKEDNTRKIKLNSFEGLWKSVSYICKYRALSAFRERTLR